MSRIETAIDERWQLLEDGSGEPLPLEWLKEMYASHRNVVQLSEPTVVVAESADSALDLLWSGIIKEPTRTTRTAVTRHAVLKQMRSTLLREEINEYMYQGSDLFVGDRIHSSIDFAAVRSNALQLIQGWSFQRSSRVEDLAAEVKAWGYALGRLREGDHAARLLSDSLSTEVPSSVKIDVVVAKPETAEQKEAWEESEQVFAELQAGVWNLEDVPDLGRRTVELLAS